MNQNKSKQSRHRGERAWYHDTGFRFGPMTLSVLSALAALAGFAVQVNAQTQQSTTLPTDPKVVAGQAQVNRNGNQQTVRQFTDRAIIDWRSFSIGPDGRVQFVQPNSGSVVLNRVVGTEASQLLGDLSANGQVFLVNNNGVFIGRGARLDTAGLVATTMNIGNDDFMAGRYRFNRAEGLQVARVENAGSIYTRQGGYTILAADAVQNIGEIVSPNGRVVLASADSMNVDLKGDQLVQFTVPTQVLRQTAQVINQGSITADGGSVMLTARAARDVAGMVVNNTGTIQARRIAEQGGEIVLMGGGGEVQSSGTLDAKGVNGSAGLISVSNLQGAAAITGNAVASSSSGAGGTIRLVGQSTGVMNNAVLDASGTKGGLIEVGGGYRGVATLNGTSEHTYVSRDSMLRADGSTATGGTITVWANDSTRFDGRLSAQGVTHGGMAEVSGRQNLAYNGEANLQATKGAMGTLLLDPSTLTITDGAAASGSYDADFNNASKLNTQIKAATADAGANTISRGTLLLSAANANVLLEATGQVTLNNQTGGVLNMPQTSGSVTIRSTTSGGVNLNNQGVSTKGGNLTIEALGTGIIQNMGALTTTGSGNISVTANSGSINVNNKISAGGNVALTATNGGVNLSADVTGKNFNVTSQGALNQSSGVIRADSLTLNTGPVSLLGANEIKALSATINAPSFSFRSATDLSIGGINLNNGAGAAKIEIRSDKNLTTSANMSVTSSAGTAELILGAGGNLNIGHNLSATGVGQHGNSAGGPSVAGASIVLTAEQGAVRQTAGTITAIDNSPRIADKKIVAPSANIRIVAGNQAVTEGNGSSCINLPADCGRVQVGNLTARSDNGSAQVYVQGFGGVTGSGSIQVTAATQPSIIVTGQLGDKNGNVIGQSSVDLSSVTLTATQTATGIIPGDNESKKQPEINLPIKGLGGITVSGNTVALGTVNSNSTSGQAAVYGISANGANGVTFNGNVTTSADAGVAAQVTGSLAQIKTTGSAVITAPQVSTVADKDVGNVNLRTNTPTLTVLGGKFINIDNTAYGGMLSVVALGRVTQGGKDATSGLELPPTDKPIGGARIVSPGGIQLLGVTTNGATGYQYNGNSGTSDLIFIGNKIEYSPGSFNTSNQTNVQLRPYSADRDVRFLYVVPEPAQQNAGITYISGGLVGLVAQFNPNANVLIGGADPGGLAPNYTGNIAIGDASSTAPQITLGSMNLTFQTSGNGRVSNIYPNGTQQIPTQWNDSSPNTAPYSSGFAIVCPGAGPCITRMTQGQIIVRDGFTNTGGNGSVRHLLLNGTGSGAGGTPPTNGGGSNNGGGSGGGGSSGGSGNSGGGGSGSNNGNGAPPPPAPPGGGGNNSNPGGTGNTNATNNPGGVPNPTTTPPPATPPGTPGSSGSASGSGSGASGGAGISGGSSGSGSGSSGPGGTNNNGTGSSGPGGSGPGGSGPGGSGPGGSGPGGSGPGGSGPGGSGPGGSDPGGSGPGGSGPGGSGPGGSGPGGSGPGGSGDPGSGPGGTGPGGSGPGGSGPGGTGPGGSDPGGSGPGGSGAGGTGGTGGGTGPGGSDPGGSGPGGTGPGGSGSGSGSGSSGSGSSGGPGGFAGGGSGGGSGGSGGSGLSGGDPGAGGSGGGTSGTGGTGGVGGTGGSGTGGSGTSGTDPGGSGTGGAGTGGSGSGAGGTGGSGGTGSGTGGSGSGAGSGGSGDPGGSGSGSGGSGSSGGPGGFAGGGSGGGSGSSGGSSLSGGDGGPGGSSGSGGSGSGSGGTGGSGSSGSGTAGDGTGGSAGSGSSSGTSGGAGSGGSGSSGSGGSSGSVGEGGAGGSGSTTNGVNGSSNNASGSLTFEGGASGQATSSSSTGQSGSGGSSQGSGQSAGDGPITLGSSSSSTNRGSGSGSNDGSEGTNNAGQPGQNGKGPSKARQMQCPDEGQQTKKVTKPGQPNSDLIEQRASGVRLRPSGGSLADQRQDCVRPASGKKNEK